MNLTGPATLLLAAAALLATPATAGALDQFGRRGRLDLPRQGAGAVQSVAGLAAARDGSAAFVLEIGALNSATDDCGTSYTPLRVHRFTLDGRQLTRGTTAGRRTRRCACTASRSTAGSSRARSRRRSIPCSRTCTSPRR